MFNDVTVTPQTVPLKWQWWMEYQVSLTLSLVMTQSHESCQSHKVVQKKSRFGMFWQIWVKTCQNETLFVRLCGIVRLTSGVGRRNGSCRHKWLLLGALNGRFLIFTLQIFWFCRHMWRPLAPSGHESESWPLIFKRLIFVIGANAGEHLRLFEGNFYPRYHSLCSTQCQCHFV